MPSPANRPTTDPMIPTTTDSSTTDASTCLREAPSVRSVASSRIRWATVIESVFAITKLPTKSAMPPKASRIVRKMPIPSWVLAVRGCLAGRRLDRGRLGEQGIDLADELGLRDAGLGADEDLVELASLSNSPRPSACRRRRSSPPASESSSPKRTRPVISYFSHRTVGECPDRLADLKLLVSAVDLSIAICAVAAGPLARGERERAQAGGGRRRRRARSRLGLADRLALAVDEGRVVREPRAARTPGRLVDLAEDVGGEGRRFGVAVLGLDRVLGADHGVGRRTTPRRRRRSSCRACR